MNVLEELIGEGGEVVDDGTGFLAIQGPSFYPENQITINFYDGTIKVWSLEGEVIETKKFKYTLI